MEKIRIVKKNDEYSTEYEIGDIFEIEGTWYGGVHISGRTGVPVSLDQEEYIKLETGADIEKTKQIQTAVSEDRDIRPGDIVQHFKREKVAADTSEYLYKVLAVAEHTESGENLVVYQGLYRPFKVYARPYEMFMGETDRERYPDIRQKYRFEKINIENQK